MTLDRFLQHVLPRDIARAWQDSSAPVARTIAEEICEWPVVYDQGRCCGNKPCTLTWRWPCDEAGGCPDEATCGGCEEPIFPDDAPIPFSLAALRACRPDMDDTPPPDTAAIVDTLLRHVTSGWTLTARGKARVRDGIVRGLVEAGVVRS